MNHNILVVKSEIDNRNSEIKVMNLDFLREKIDGIDEKILNLLIKRYEYTKDIGNLKLETNHSIYVPEREEYLFTRLEKLNNAVIPNNILKAIFTEIISGGRQIEHPINIICKKDKPFLQAYVAFAKLGKSISLLFLDNYKEMFSKVKESCSNYSIILFEDSRKGLFTTPLPEFLDSELSICAEIIINNPEKQKNWKRFLFIGNNPPKPTNTDKTLIYFVSGKTSKVNIHKLLATYPIKTRIIGNFQLSKKSDNYTFIELFKHIEDDSLTELLHSIEKNCSFLKILGSFPS